MGNLFKTILLFICLCFSYTLPAQSYKEFIRLAEKMYASKDYRTSDDLYSEAFKTEKKNPTHLYNAACVASLLNDKDKAFVLLDLAFTNGWNDLRHLKQDSDLKPLHNDTRWTALLARMQMKVDEMEVLYDKPLQKQLLEISTQDQEIRQQYIDATNKFGFANPAVDSLIKVMVYTDSVDLVAIRKILDERGWVGADKVGQEANQTLFLVIQHADLKTQQKYLPMMRNAVKSGNANASSLALLEDRVALREGRKQIYGSQVGRDPNTNKFYVSPLEDPDNVDKRRAEVGLGPLADYVLNWNILWDVAEYKRQLPELEKLIRK